MTTYAWLVINHGILPKTNCEVVSGHVWVVANEKIAMYTEDCKACYFFQVKIYSSDNFPKLNHQ